MGSNRIGYSPRRCKQRELSGPESGNGGNGYVHLSMPLYKSCLDIDRRIISSPPDQRQPLAVPNHNLGRVHTTLFRTGRDRSRPVRAQLLVSTRGQLERSFRILETTSRHGTSGRDRSRSVAPCQIYRVDARVGATDLSANQPLLAHAFLIYFFPF